MLEREEMKLFLTICKAIRELQEFAKELGEPVSTYSTVSMDTVYSRFPQPRHKCDTLVKQLEEIGYIKVNKNYKNKPCYIGLDEQGAEFVKQLKEKKQEEQQCQ